MFLVPNLFNFCMRVSLSYYDLSNAARISSSPSPGISTSARDAWSASAYATLLKLEWQTTGYEASLTDSSTQQPIRKCPTCWVSRDIQQTANQPHLANCEVGFHVSIIINVCFCWCILN